MNRVNVKTGYYKVLKEILNKVDYPLAATLRDTQNYVRSADTGLSIFDLPAKSKKTSPSLVSG